MEATIRRQRLTLFLIAVILGCLFASVARAQEEDYEDPETGFIYKPYYAGLCDMLTEWGPAWNFFDCYRRKYGDGAAALASETVTTTLDADGTFVTDIERTFEDGRVLHYRQVGKLRERRRAVAGTLNGECRPNTAR